MTVVSVIIGLVGGTWHWLSKPIVEVNDLCPHNFTCPPVLARFARGAFGIDDGMFGVVVAIAVFLLIAAALYVLSRRTARTSQVRHSN